MCNRLDAMPACDRRTDILPRNSPRYAYAKLHCELREKRISSVSKRV